MSSVFSPAMFVAVTVFYRNSRKYLDHESKEFYPEQWQRIRPIRVVTSQGHLTVIGSKVLLCLLENLFF